MKRCPSCQRNYDDAQSFCFDEGTPLVRVASTYDPHKTLLASAPLPPLAASAAPPRQYINAARQQSPNYPHQSPPPQQQQWGAPVPARRGGSTNTVLLSVIGLLIVAGIGLAIYFMTRSKSSATTSSPSSSGSPASSSSSAGSMSASNKFVGRWKPATNKDSDGVVTFKADGTWELRLKGGSSSSGTYSPGDGKASLDIGGTQYRFNISTEGSQLVMEEMGGDSDKEYLNRIE
jgi:hypothetical protein